MIDSSDEQSDGELARRVLDGEKRAFDAIVLRHKLALYRIVVRLTGDDDDALDIVQEAFVSAHQALRRYDPARPMRAWLTRIAVNKARDWRRRRAVRRFVAAFLPIDEGLEVSAPQPSPEVQAADREELTKVTAAIAMLPANLAEVLVLRAIEGQSQAEVADALGISEKAVETRLYRARRRLSELRG